MINAVDLVKVFNKIERLFTIAVIVYRKMLGITQYNRGYMKQVYISYQAICSKIQIFPL